MNGTARLKDLDGYLRDIWLECCGHMSHFSIGDAWRGEELNDSLTVERVFSSANTLEHVYDYGTSSNTKVKVVAARKGSPLTKHPIYLMGRNLLPEAECKVCKNRRGICVWNAFMTSKNQVCFVMSTLKNIHTKTMAIRCRL